VLLITKSEDLVKLRTLAELCSKDFFDDPSLLVVVWRKILEVLVLALAMPPVVEKKVRKEEAEEEEGSEEARDFGRLF